MGVLFLIIVGAILGWLASIITRAESRQAILLNVGVGIAGAFIAGLVLNPLFGGHSLLGQRYDVLALLIALLGSVIFLVALNLTRRVKG
ncbi:GlsB/YeaQ/YmgE family stress response membrane protein [Paraurantiacibacter namhicola]|uniref:Transglycosylase associated protein n=1 Tax=Paraurantiacibacter namhicola TaxID=645517 RepID=A0A1C7D6K3_9SPHN|nr:GlsB/YeaQ/YmgE family stress response membrane protein [Paraurantiacibacter namhicola]ANU06933.1 hypothetical protein A6F65_00611 [Paraurantiacibacter namhicola]